MEPVAHPSDPHPAAMRQIALGMQPSASQPADPFLKWAGGKTQLLDHLLPYVPASYGRYIEPFLGGGALFFRLSPGAAILADLNPELINCYRAVRDDVEALVQELRGYVNDEHFFYAVRQLDPGSISPVQRAARTIYLNKTCYNGLYRVNKSGQFNVPFGRRNNPRICDEARLRAAHDLLQGVELVCADYKTTLSMHAQPGDFIYLDPPYYPDDGYADFKRYTKEFFYEDDHIELRDEFSRLVGIGCWALLTNRNVPFVRQLYSRFDCKVVDARRNISRDASTRRGQDLIVAATRRIGQARERRGPARIGLLEHFPGTRYMGSKYRVLPFLWDCVSSLPFSSVLDAFSGSACVSYMFKQNGKRVVSNDFMHFTYQFAKAIIENSSVCLDESDLAMLLCPNRRSGDFVAQTFRGLYFSDEENAFLDRVRANVELLDNPAKRSLALAALARACLKRRPRGIFTFTGYRYDDGRRDLRTDLRQHFIESAYAFNAAVFDNGFANQALNRDVFDLDAHADLVYLDPPYFTRNSDNDYVRRYHFVEGLVRQWRGVQIDLTTVTKKIRTYQTPFSSRDTVHGAFDTLFSRFRDSIIVLSYSSNSIPDKADLVGMLKQYKKQVVVREVDHLYSFGTHAHKVGNNANRVKEYVFIGT